MKKHDVKVDIAGFNISKEDYEHLGLKDFEGVPSFLLYTAPGKYTQYEFGDGVTAGDFASFMAKHGVKGF